MQTSPERAGSAAFLVFFALTCGVTYPLILQLGSMVKNLGDPLINSWILDWGSSHIASVELRDGLGQL